METVCQFLKKLNVKLLYAPAISLLGNIPTRIEKNRNPNTYLYITVHRNTIHNSEKVETCLSTDEQIDKMWYAIPT